MFAYADAHRYRLGANHLQIPVNMAKHAATMTNMRDGYMSVDGNGGHQPHYYPNTVPGAPAPNPTFAPPAVEIQAVLDRHTRPTEDVDFIQPGELYRRVLDDMHKEHLVSNIVGHLCGAKQHIQYRQTALFYKADEEYGSRVAAGLELDLERVKQLAAMTQEERVQATLS